MSSSNGIKANEKPVSNNMSFVYAENEEKEFVRVPNDWLKKILGIATNLSELNNDVGFVDKLVSDLKNYYLKTETYSKDEIDDKMSLIPRFSVQVVSILPTENISDTTVYLVPSNEDDNNLYTEYINVNGLWEMLGAQKASNVEVTKEAIESALGYTPANSSDISNFSGSWNDLTDKPFGEEHATEILLNERTVEDSQTQIEELDGVEFLDDSMEFLYNKLIITFDNVKYELDAFEYDSRPHWGDSRLIVQDSNPVDVPFLLETNWGTPSGSLFGEEIPVWYLSLNDSIVGTPHTIKIEAITGETIIKQLDEKYIPDTIARTEDKEWKLLRSVTIPEDPSTDNSGVEWVITRNETNPNGVASFRFETDYEDNPFSVREVFVSANVGMGTDMNGNYIMMGERNSNGTWKEDTLGQFQVDKNVMVKKYMRIESIKNTGYSESKTQDNWGYMTARTIQQMILNREDRDITSLCFGTYSNTYLNVGSIINIYGR